MPINDTDKYKRELAHIIATRTNYGREETYDAILSGIVDAARGNVSQKQALLDVFFQNFGTPLSILADTVDVRENMFEGYTFPEGTRLDLSLTDSLTNLKSCSFKYTKGLKIFVAPSSLRFIGSSVFNGSSVEVVDLKKADVLNLNDEVFAYCAKLVAVRLPDTLKEISYSAFEGCSDSIRIIYEGQNKLALKGGSAEEREFVKKHLERLDENGESKVKYKITAPENTTWQVSYTVPNDYKLIKVLRASGPRYGVDIKIEPSEDGENVILQVLGDADSLPKWAENVIFHNDIDAEKKAAKWLTKVQQAANQAIKGDNNK